MLLSDGLGNVGGNAQAVLRDAREAMRGGVRIDTIGLGSTQIVLLVITAIVGALTVLPGRATVQEGGVHLVLFAAFVFLAVNP